MGQTVQYDAEMYLRRDERCVELDGFVELFFSIIQMADVQQCLPQLGISSCVFGTKFYRSGQRHGCRPKLAFLKQGTSKKKMSVEVVGEKPYKLLTCLCCFGVASHRVQQSNAIHSCGFVAGSEL